MGGAERLAKHHAQGKLDARARIDALVDDGSFLELGTLTGGDEAPAEAIVLGSGRVSGRPVIVAAEDFTVLAGTISHTANSKRYRAAELALRDKVPLVMILDGAGFRAAGLHLDEHRGAATQRNETNLACRRRDPSSKAAIALELAPRGGGLRATAAALAGLKLTGETSRHRARAAPTHVHRRRGALPYPRWR